MIIGFSEERIDAKELHSEKVEKAEVLHDAMFSTYYITTCIGKPWLHGRRGP